MQRWTKRVGAERVREAAALAESYQALTLSKQRQSPTDQIPQVACVMVDDGRNQIRKRQDSSEAWLPRVLGKKRLAGTWSRLHARGFHAARHKAFVADGAASHWTIHRKYFSHFTPILDFTHAICYVMQQHYVNNRWTFIGKLTTIEIRKLYRYKSVNFSFKRDTASPIRYVNC
jgi:hypothetical protein